MTDDKISWHILPVEIRLMTLKALSKTGCSLANYATVCREWREIIERHNFTRIKLTIPRLSEFDAMTRRNQIHVRYIWLCLELQDYGRAESAPLELKQQGMDNTDSTATKRAIHSPSDSVYWFKYLTFEPDVPSTNCDRGQLPESMPAAANVDQHRWTDDENPFTHLPIRKVFDKIMGKGPFKSYEDEERWWFSLPLAPAVTAVLLRQQTRRRWKPKALSRLVSQFPRLREFHYEPWREWNLLKQRAIDLDYQLLFESLASCHLTKLTLFENFNQRYPLHFRICSSLRQAKRGVGRVVAKASLELEHLSASFIIDASHFFQAREPSWKWYNLTTLILTSELLVPNENLDEANDMLLEAAVAAREMPNLELLEIWNGRAGLAGLFRYQTPKYLQERFFKQPTVITWRGTWDFVLTPPVIEAWEAVTYGHHGNAYIIDKEVVDVNAIKSHGDAVYHLKLSKLVIRPLSLRQIRTEHMVGEEMFLVNQT
ncbi:hypothetical protein GGI43DRAFT_428544 [Trichoderma evansii]